MKRLAVYAGSFDPLTLGHLDIARRVSALFEELHLVVAVNPKKAALFSTDEKLAMLEASVKDLRPQCKIVIRAHEGLIVNYCKNIGSQVLIRGLRALSDFESEFQMATMNRHLNGAIETLHIMTDEKYFFLSSSLVKELAQWDVDLNELVPAPVAVALKAKMGKKGEEK